MLDSRLQYARVEKTGKFAFHLILFCILGAGGHDLGSMEVKTDEGEVKSNNLVTTSV
jgi:hypothetical protein